MRSKPNNKIKYNVDNYNIDLDINIDKDIEDDINYFHIDKDILSNIELPSNFKKEIKKPVKEIKREKKKIIRYKLLDMIIVLICVLPIIGIINPNVFEKIPQAYTIFNNINKTLKKDKIMSILGINKKGEAIEGDIGSSKDTVYIKEEDINAPTNNYEAIKLIHSLANTLIHAEYKWQCSEITPKTIEMAIEGVEFIDDDYDRMHLRNSLKKWSKGDFSDSVEVHNYVWEMLDGSVGKADDIDAKEIEKIKNKYFDN